MKKRIVRLVIEEIVGECHDRPAQVSLLIHLERRQAYAAGRPKESYRDHRYGTSHAILDVARDLARRLPDAQIAESSIGSGITLDMERLDKRPRGHVVRNSHRIPVFNRAAPTPWLTMAEADRPARYRRDHARRLISRRSLPARGPCLCAIGHSPRDLERPLRATTVRRDKDGATISATKARRPARAHEFDHSQRGNYVAVSGGPRKRPSSCWVTKRPVASSKTSAAIELPLKSKSKASRRLADVAEAGLLEAAVEQPVLAAEQLVADERGEEVDRGQLLGLGLEQPRLEGGGHAGAAELAQGALQFDEVHVGIASWVFCAMTSR